MPEGFEGEPQQEEHWSFGDFLGVGKSGENVRNLSSRVLGFDTIDELVGKLREGGMGPEEINDLRSVLAFRRRKHESDEDYQVRMRAAEQLETATGRMTWKPGERDPEDTDIRGDSLSGSIHRTTSRGVRQQMDDIDVGDAFGEERD